MVFIAYRAAVLDAFDYYANGIKVDVNRLVYSLGSPRKTDISARDVAARIKEAFPDFEPCAYLNGTHQADSFKWLIGMRIGASTRTLGWVGAKFMEATQVGYHLARGRYLSYAPPAMLQAGRAVLASSWPFDKGVRQAAWNALRHPLSLLRTQHLQTIVMIQPIDVAEDGTQNMCDGCPDMTVHEGKLVWSCRLEEPRTFGTFVQSVPKVVPADRAG